MHVQENKREAGNANAYHQHVHTAPHCQMQRAISIKIANACMDGCTDFGVHVRDRARFWPCVR